MRITPMDFTLLNWLVLAGIVVIFASGVASFVALSQKKKQIDAVIKGTQETMRRLTDDLNKKTRELEKVINDELKKDKK